MKKIILWVLFIVSTYFPALSAQVLSVGDNAVEKEWYIEGKALEVLEDPSGRLSLSQVLSPSISRKFRAQESTGTFEYVVNTSSTYWIRFSVKKSLHCDKFFVFENLDLHIDRFEFYKPDHLNPTSYSKSSTGYALPFFNREYPHKNFVFDLSLDTVPQVYYVRIKSHNHNPFIFKIKHSREFVHYALNEYYLLGMFYGILAIMAVYNLLMYFSLKDKVYLFYIFYVLCSCFVALGEDGTGFQYLWPNFPQLNEMVSTYAPLLLMLSFTFYSRYFLELPKVLPTMDKVVLVVVGLYSAVFLLNILWPGVGADFPLFIFPFLVIYIASFLCLFAGIRQARYYIIGYSILLFSILLMILRIVGVLHNDLIFMVYSFNIGLVFEIVILSFALGDRIRIIKIAHEKAQDQVIEQLRENEQLKDRINSELEEQVRSRTRTIEEKNDQLQEAYQEIQRMNELLDADNKELKTNVTELTKARVLAKELGFDEFSKIFPDKDSCLKYLVDLKWANGYSCKKCGNAKWCKGKGEYFRRCTKCRYDESPTAYTIFHKLKFPVTKAFYMLFLVYANKGKVTSIELSQILELRQSTCWSFSKKVTDMMKSKKKTNEVGADGWGGLVLDPENAD